MRLSNGGISKVTGEPHTAESIARYQAIGFKAAARRLEREEAVTCNIAPELLPLWKRVRSSIKGTPEQRLAAFQLYVHNHQAERVEALGNFADEKLEALLAERARRDELEAAELAAAEVPF
jgi:hypothetical protein